MTLQQALDLAFDDLLFYDSTSADIARAFTSLEQVIARVALSEYDGSSPTVTSTSLVSFQRLQDSFEGNGEFRQLRTVIPRLIRCVSAGTVATRLVQWLSTSRVQKSHDPGE